MARANTGSVGRAAEATALTHLKSEGLKEIESNFRCRMGEIDLIMKDGNCLVFAEVRFREDQATTSLPIRISQSRLKALWRCLKASTDIGDCGQTSAGRCSLNHADVGTPTSFFLRPMRQSAE